MNLLVDNVPGVVGHLSSERTKEFSRKRVRFQNIHMDKMGCLGSDDLLLLQSMAPP